VGRPGHSDAGGLERIHSVVKAVSEALVPAAPPKFYSLMFPRGQIQNPLLTEGQSFLQIDVLFVFGVLKAVKHILPNFFKILGID
jgi:hypothetical protein